jgi:hypothetical protein
MFLLKMTVNERYRCEELSEDLATQSKCRLPHFAALIASLA